jgi:hypothetical protein
MRRGLHDVKLARVRSLSSLVWHQISTSYIRERGPRQTKNRVPELEVFRPPEAAVK